MNKRLLIEVRARKQGAGYVGICPCHNDKEPSLSIKYVNGRANPLVHCFAGCTFGELVEYFKSVGCWVDEQGRRNVFR